MPAENHNSTRFLDGLRGLAALLVVFEGVLGNRALVSGSVFQPLVRTRQRFM